VVAAWQRLIVILKDDFVPYLNMIMQPLFKDIEQMKSLEE